MIILTIPPVVNSILGGDSSIEYDHLVLSSIAINPLTLLVTANLRLTSTSNPEMQEITGTLRIENSSGVLTVEVGKLDFYRRVQLSGAQITSVNTIISNAQNALESGLISLGVIGGTQSPGA